MKENKIIKNYIKNNELCLEEIVNDYTNYVSKIIDNFSRYSIIEEDKEEIVADVFFILWKNTNRLDNSKKLSSYLAGITKNLLKEFFRKNKTKYENIDDYENVLKDVNDDISIIDESYEKIQKIESKLKCLKQLDKDIFIEYYYNSKSIKDIAKKYTISEFSVKQRLYRIRNKIKKEVQNGF